MKNELGVSNKAGTKGLGGSQWNEQENWGVKPPNPRQFEPCIRIVYLVDSQSMKMLASNFDMLADENLN